jgi:ribonuclease J
MGNKRPTKNVPQRKKVPIIYVGGAKMAKIIIHRGAKQIGGVSVEISTDVAKVFIDLGENLPGTDTPAPEIDGLTYGSGKNSALFLTHYHGDHIGLLDKALPDVPVYMGAIAKKILLNLAERIYKERLPLFQNIQPIGNGEIIVGDIKVTPIPYADHSAVDAFMFVVEADGCRILHTGDFRFHGMQGETTLEMLNRFAKNIDYIICEGTLLSREGVAPKSEAEIMREAAEIMATCPYVFVLCSSTHIERILSFYKANPKGRLFICDKYQKKQIAAASEALSDLGGSNFNMKFVYDYAPNLDSHMEEKGFCMMVRQGDYFKKIMEKFNEKIVIYSMWTGYLDERTKNQDLVDFLAPYKYHVFHTSGHASKEDLRKLFDIINPKRGVIPIHTNAPEKFRDIVPKNMLHLLRDGEIFITNTTNRPPTQAWRETMYSREEVTTTIENEVKSAPETLYNNRYVKTADTADGVRANEIVAEILLKNLDALSNIKQITRQETYKTPSHEKLAREVVLGSSNRSEELTAKWLYHKEILGLGKVLDFQVPLKNVQADKAGKVDLLTHNSDTNIAHLLELKVPDSTETLLRCVLEIYTYWCIEKKKKLLDEFKISGAELRKGILVYNPSRPYADFLSDECNMVRELMAKLDVDFFVLSADNTQILPPYSF